MGAEHATKTNFSTSQTPGSFAGKSFVSAKLNAFETKLKQLDSFFHEPGAGHVHKTPSAGQLPELLNLREPILSDIREFQGTEREAAQKLVAKTVCGQTIDFIKTGKF